jgi:microcystin-dependent protein
MSQPFLGEIDIMAFAFAPRGYAQCSGQLMAINQNQALFALLGTMYGGNGVQTFQLPDMRSRVPMHVGNGYVQGEAAGAESVTLHIPNIPSHIHTATVNCSSAGGTANDPSGKVWSKDLGTKSATYSNAAPSGTMKTGAMFASSSGGNQPHENRQPYLVVNFIIALQGIFPSRN